MNLSYFDVGKRATGFWSKTCFWMFLIVSWISPNIWWNPAKITATGALGVSGIELPIRFHRWIRPQGWSQCRRPIRCRLGLLQGLLWLFCDLLVKSMLIVINAPKPVLSRQIGNENAGLQLFFGPAKPAIKMLQKITNGFANSSLILTYSD